MAGKAEAEVIEAQAGGDPLPLRRPDAHLHFAVNLAEILQLRSEEHTSELQSQR